MAELVHHSHRFAFCKSQARGPLKCWPYLPLCAGTQLTAQPKPPSMLGWRPLQKPSTCCPAAPCSTLQY